MFRQTSLDVFIYLRKSRKDLEEERIAAEKGQSYDTLDRHRNRLMELVKIEKHNIVKIYEEIVTGESIIERPVIQEMLKQVEKGVVDAVLVIDIDRLGRGDMFDAGIIDRAFRYSNTKILTITEVFDPSDENWELVFGIKSLVARQEFKQINKRLYNGRIDSVKEGKHIAKKPPYGYKRDNDLRLIPDPNTSWVVEKIYQWCIEGKGRRIIAIELNQMGIIPPSGKGKMWSMTSIRNILNNEVYQGDMVWGKTKNVKRNGKYKTTKLPEEQWIIKRDAHEAIVSREVFRKANETIQARYVPPTSEPEKLVNVMAGILRCEVCGYSMWRLKTYTKKNEGTNSGYMVCQNSECRRTKIQKGASYKRVEDALIIGLEKILNEFQVMYTGQQVDTINNKLKPLKELLHSKESELTELNEQLENIHDFLERKIYDLEKFLDRQNVINNKIKMIQEEISNLEREIQREQSQVKNINEFIPALINVMDAYKSTDDVYKKNRLLKTILEKATFRRPQDSTHPSDFTLTLYPKI